MVSHDVVADSEGEEESMTLNLTGTVSSIQPAEANTSIALSNISDFTAVEKADTSTITSFTIDPSAPPVKPRPKPRPRGKAAQSGTSVSSSSSFPPSIEGVPPPREFSTNDSIEAPLSIADRAKSRTRKPTQKLTINPITSNDSSTIIDIPTDSEDELLLIPPMPSKKTKPKPKPLKANIIEIPDTQPIPTSDTLPILPDTSSQLPPSDPISTPDIPKNNEETLSPLSSPVRTTKRKRANLIEDDDYDSLAMPPPAIPEPPPFFASSSSLSAPPSVDITPEPEASPKKKAKKPSKKQAEDEDEAIPKKKKPPAKPRKKKGAEDLVASYKSNEFIDDSDDEGGGALSVPALDKPSSTSSRPSTNYATEVVLPAKRTSPGDIFDEREEPPPKKGKKSRKKKADDDDEAEYGAAPSEDKEVTKAKPKAAKKPKAPPKPKTKVKGKGKARQEDDTIGTEANEDIGDTLANPTEDSERDTNFDEPGPSVQKEPVKEHSPPPAKTPKPRSNVPPTSFRAETPTASSFARLNYRHSIAGDAKPTSMSELIRKVSSPASSSPRSFSPFMKSSRSALRRIAPLHPNRRTPPPLPPKPPPPKKSKKQLALEEKWEEELEEEIEGWASLTTAERDLMRKAKHDKEMGFED